MEPQCTQGKALKDSYDKFIVCGGTSTTISTCPGNYDCFFDGNTYGCCPTKGKKDFENFERISIKNFQISKILKL